MNSPWSMGLLLSSYRCKFNSGCLFGMIASILRDMRYAPEHKAEVHQHIVEDAARQVRAEGLTGAGVATIMRRTGLTHGGFYKHFESKEKLLTESVAEAFRDFAESSGDAV